MNNVHNDHQNMVEAFPWQSDDQKEGYLAYVQYRKQLGLPPPPTIDIALVWLIQKNHESYEWQRDTFGDQISTLQGDIRALQYKLNQLVPSTDANKPA
jgi:hypothetical protein